ncbi:transcription factor LHW-like isoform X2 [Nicotiana tabacum]|uniref:Transcription factor LHW-like isoform X2 n=1 Tax=Nicotiana tabacum TaxID=4097 RepID=A0A1S3XY15_TOBAC|nr:PREDICTED: transcription factor LHW-like isoform X2 [Nicotiana tabacum]
MGYWLKEVLKTLCGVNQWSYAVFWKIGCQNTKLLIWEESYCETSTFSGLHGTCEVENPKLAFQDWSACWDSGEVQNSQLLNQAGESLCLLVKRMMMDKQFNLVGEGLIGRAAAIGNHQWILSKGRSKDAHPPEVLKELSQQFSSGIQTISVIPVLPHGVVQFGSYLHILENMGFVEDVRTLISQLGCVPGVLLSDENAMKEPAPSTARPVYPGSSVSMVSCGRAKVMTSSSIIASCNYSANSIQAERFIGQTSSLAGQIQECMQSSDSTFQASNITGRFAKYHDDHFHKKISPEVTSYMSTNSQLTNNVIKAEVIPPNPDVWTKQQASLHIPKPRFCQESSVGSLTLDSGSIRLTEQQISGENNLAKNNSTLPNGFRASQPRIGDVLTSNFHENIVLPSTGVTELYKEVNKYQKSMPSPNVFLDAIRPPHKIISCTEFTGNGLQIGSSELKASSSYDVVNDVINNRSLDGRGTQFLLDGSKRMVENDLFQALGIMSTRDEQPSSSEYIQDVYGEKHEHGVQNPLFDNAKFEDVCVQSQSGYDLFDVLGADFKNRLLNGSWSDEQSKGPDSNTKDCINNCSTSKISRDASSTVNQGNSDSGMFSMTGFDRILETMVSNRTTKQSLEDNLSCRTTLTNLSSSSSPNASCFYGRVGFSSQIQGELYGPPKTLSKSGATSSDSFKYECSKENTGTHSQSCSIYGSQTSSWVESGHGTKPLSSVSTGYSKKPDEMSKTSRKRLKPGENPRPRPKDRQMIQDRVKELREIVPNGAKCSIDALLERTIKHMLFLQSVTKHADKLKQTGESKIISKEGGLLLKDNLEGGATWAYEVSSQSMVCPIVVEDLNQPRQMLVEMLCEERGLFLEIADIIRGLGLTILKGVMETRNDKIWARFAVEAYRNVTRMDIFISLVRLLESTAKGETEPANANDNNTAVVNLFHQAASIPATGSLL